jgi:hypothetical protein
MPVPVFLKRETGGGQVREGFLQPRREHHSLDRTQL